MLIKRDNVGRNRARANGQPLPKNDVECFGSRHGSWQRALRSVAKCRQIEAMPQYVSAYQIELAVAKFQQPLTAHRSSIPTPSTLGELESRNPCALSFRTKHQRSLSYRASQHPNRTRPPASHSAPSHSIKHQTTRGQRPGTRTITGLPLVTLISGSARTATPVHCVVMPLFRGPSRCRKSTCDRRNRQPQLSFRVPCNRW